MNKMGLTPTDFIEHNMNAYDDLSNFDHLFRKFCTDSQNPDLHIPDEQRYSELECNKILDVVPGVSNFKELLKTIDNELSQNVA